MGIFGKAVWMFINLILPKPIRQPILNRIERTKRALTSTPELRLLWKIVLFPIRLILSLLGALVKTFLLWVMPTKMYNDNIFLLKQFYMDVASKHMDISLAWKRMQLTHELFTKGAEKRMSYGKRNPDKTFYIIRPYYFLEPNELIYRNVANLLTQYYYALQKLSYALENGWIPVVDWENYGMMPHSEEYPVNGTMNAWEYYWQQPSEYPLEEVYQSKNVILSTRNIGQYGYIPNCAMKPPFEEYAEKIVEQCPKYASRIHFCKNTERYIEAAYKNLFPEGKRILGVLLRGSSYGVHSTQNGSHPVQVGIKELIRTSRKYIEEWKMDYIFFVNEMQEMVDIMQETFGPQLIVLPRMRDHMERPADGIVKNPMYLPGNRYQTNLDYVTEIALLSRCTSLLACMSSGTRTALIWNDGNYENTKIFEKGLW